MPDYSQMSDEEINSLLEQKRAQTQPQVQPQVDYSAMSDEEIDQMLEQKRAQAQPIDGSPGMAALEGFGQGATLGYLPQIQAAAEPITTAIGNIITGQEIEPDPYVQARDINIERQKREAAASPIASGLGTVGGALATSLVPGGALAKGASLGTKIAKGVGTGATMGALQAPDSEKGVVDPLALEQRVENLKTGGLIGGAIPAAAGAAKGVRSIYKGIAPKLKDISQKLAFKSTGAMLKDMRKAYDRKTVNRIGQKLLDEDIVKAGDTFDDIASKTKMKTDEIGSRIGEIYSKGDEALIGVKPKDYPLEIQNELIKTEINPVKIANALEIEITRDLKKTVGGRKAIKALRTHFDEIRDGGQRGNLKYLIDKRREFDSLINHAKKTQELPLVQQKLKQMTDRLNKIAQSRLKVVDKVKGTKFNKDIIKANKDFSDLISVKKIAEDRVAREAANRAFSLGDRTAGVGGAIAGMAAGGGAGAIVGAAAMATLGKLARQRGGPIAARIAEKTANALNKDPKLLGRFSDILIKSANESPEAYVKTIMKIRAANPDFDKRVRRLK